MPEDQAPYDCGPAFVPSRRVATHRLVLAFVAAAIFFCGAIYFDRLCEPGDPSIRFGHSLCLSGCCEP